jgi:signal transduction histidine kinase
VNARPAENDILDLSKVEAGRIELEVGRFHVPTALDNALTLIRERASRHGIALDIAVDERVGDIVADERKVKQILLNLLSNAVKFTPEGGRVGLTATAADGVVTIAVRDTGIGIAPEDQAAIFEEFRQVGREDARKQEGTGLGLTLAKKFVELQVTARRLPMAAVQPRWRNMLWSAYLLGPCAVGEGDGHAGPDR